MSKRKAAVNDFIYELSDSEEVQISSEDEAKDAKIQRSEVQKQVSSTQNKPSSQESVIEVVNLDCSADGDWILVSPTKKHNGGKTSPDDDTESRCSAKSPQQTETVDTGHVDPDPNLTTICNDDILIDSPASSASNNDLGVVGCENRTPLLTVTFKDKKMAKKYKDKVKAFMLRLIKLHDEENITGSESETDLELDVWPEDLLNEEEEVVEDIAEEEDNLFFVDTAPGVDSMEEVPTYRQNSTLISNIPDKETTPPPTLRRGPTCFNCDGAHNLRDCTLPRNNMRIAENRKNMVRVGRYHVEDDQKFGHLVPGRISGQLRHAMGLKRHELPMYIYRMRLLGYPPGWLEEARISHSGITMFDSTGQAIQDPEEEDGEVCEPGSKDKFDIKKILDFPGFNVPASSRYKEEAHLYGLPPMSEQDSKLLMLQVLAPNAMKAYKRKKLTLFPTSANNSALEGQAEMELDDGDEMPEFPSVPPLPDEAPPPPPPPPPPLPTPPPPGTDDSEDKSASDLEVVEVIKVNEIPIPEDDFMVVDTTDDDEAVKPIPNRGLTSPTLDDLEAKKQKLLEALKGDSTSVDLSDKTASDVDEIEPSADKPIFVELNEKTSVEISNEKNIETTEHGNSVESDMDSQASASSRSETKNVKEPHTPTDRTGHVKSSSYGTPVMNIASSYKKLPSDEKFSKDICDVINFENLPNSTGKYKKISSLLKKVKSEVDRIQDS